MEDKQGIEPVRNVSSVETHRDKRNIPAGLQKPRRAPHTAWRRTLQKDCHLELSEGWFFLQWVNCG